MSFDFTTWLRRIVLNYLHYRTNHDLTVPFLDTWWLRWSWRLLRRTKIAYFIRFLFFLPTFHQWFQINLFNDYRRLIIPWITTFLINRRFLFLLLLLLLLHIDFFRIFTCIVNTLFRSLLFIFSILSLFCF
jgi:hypothetical protein